MLGKLSIDAGPVVRNSWLSSGIGNLRANSNNKGPGSPPAEGGEIANEG